MSLLNTIGSGIGDVFTPSCWKYINGENTNTCISGNAVYSSVGLLGFGGAAGGPSKIKADHFDFSGGNRATQGQPLFGIQTKIQKPSSMASTITNTR
jgi:hypothetical protein